MVDFIFKHYTGMADMSDTSPLRFICVCVCMHQSEVMTPHALDTNSHCSEPERTADHETQSRIICIMLDGAIHYKLYLLKLTMAVDNIVLRIIKGSF